MNKGEQTSTSGPEDEIPKDVGSILDREFKLFQMSQHIEDVFWIADWKEKRTIFASGSYETIWGRKIEDLYSDPKNWVDAIHEDDRERAWQRFEELGEGGSYDEEYRITRPDGEIRWIRDRGYPVKDDEGRVFRIVGIAQDITDKKQTGERLERSERKYRELTEQINDWIWEVDIEGKYTYISPRVKDILGYEPHEIMGRSAFEFMPKDDAGRIKEIFFKHLKERKEIKNLENVCIAKDGSHRTLETNGAPILDENGEIMGFRGIDRDITDRKRIEEDLKRSEEKFRSMAEYSQNFVTMIDMEHRITYINHPVSGLKKEEVIGSSVYDFIQPEYREMVKERINAVFTTGDSDEFVSQASGPEGSISWYDNRIGPIMIDGNVQGATFIASDITKSKEYEIELKNTLDATTDGIWTWNFEKDELTFSPKYYTMLGYEPDEFPASFDSWKDLIHPDDLEDALKSASEYLLEKPDRYENSFRLRTKEGDYRWIRSIGRVVKRDLEGQAYYMIGNHEDITERKKTIEELKDSERRFRTLIETSPMSILLLRDGKYIYGNQAGAEMMGFTDPDDIIGVDALSVISPEMKDTIMERMKRTVKGESNPPLEMEILRKDGSRVWSLSRSTPIVMDGKKTTLVVSQDISDLKKVREALKHSEEKFRSMIEKGSDVIYLINKEGKIEFLSSSYERVFKIPKEDIMNKNVADYIIDKLHPEDVEEIMEKFSRMLSGEKDEIEAQCRYLDPTDNYRHLDIRAQNRFDDPAVKGLVLNVRDITEKKMNELELLKEKARAEFYLDLLGHDLGNIHQGVGGALQMMKTNLDDEKRLRSLLDISSKSIRNSINLTKEVMMLSKIMGQEPEFQMIDLEKVVKNTVNEITRTFPGKYPRVEIDIKVEKVMADILLKEIFSNLLHNSMRLQGINPWVLIKADHADEGIEILVSDKGPGIPDDMKRKLFKKYGIRGERSRTGLGLSIVNALVDRYKGSIEVMDRIEGDPSKGTTFRLILPS